MSRSESPVFYRTRRNADALSAGACRMRFREGPFCALRRLSATVLLCTLDRKSKVGRSRTRQPEPPGVKPHPLQERRGDAAARTDAGLTRRSSMKPPRIVGGFRPMISFARSPKLFGILKIYEAPTATGMSSG
jgi:hypothetical protein